MTCTQDRFLKDVATHEMHILHEDGIYRHIRFKRPGTGCMHFDLITYPGHLVYSGDMGCYVFSRLNDMFEFFRTDRRSDDGLYINRSYWAEKLQAVDGGRSHVEGCKEFSEERFNRAVTGDLIQWIRDHRDDTTKEERRELWDAVMWDVIGADSDGGGYRKQCAAHDFWHEIKPGLKFEFYDFGEHTVTDYTFSFIWCCYALAFGVKKYDEAKGAAA